MRACCAATCASTDCRFDPTRWAPEAAEGRPKFSYFPFGAGTRVCIGEQFAYLQLQTIVANITRLFKFRNVDGSTGKTVGTDYASLFSRPLEPANIYWERRVKA